MARKKVTDPTQGALGKEFFGNANSAVVPGQDERDTGVSLFEAITNTGKATEVSTEENYSLFADESMIKEDRGPDYNRSSWFKLGQADATVNPYEAEQDRRYSMDPRALKIFRVAALAVVAIVLAVILPSPSYSKYFTFTFSGIVTGLTGNIGGLFDFLSGTTTAPEGLVNYKFCTYMVIFFAGVALSMTGAVYQGSLKNALVSPTTLGINSGATVGIAIFTLLAPIELLDPIWEGTSSYTDMLSVIDYYNSLTLSEYLLVTEGRAFASILGCFVVVGLVMLVSFLVGRGNTSSFALIICGQVVAQVATSIVEFIRAFVIENDLTGTKSTVIKAAQSGSISMMSTWRDLVLVAIPVLLCVVIIVAMSRKLNLLAFSDEEARSMGIATERLRWTVIGVCTLMTAVVISFCGNISFVGFAVPLIVRRYIGPDFTYLLPACAVLGGTMLVGTYWFTDLGIMEYFGLPTSVNTLTSTLGTIMFVFATLSQRKANRSSDWL